MVTLPTVRAGTRGDGGGASLSRSGTTKRGEALRRPKVAALTLRDKCGYHGLNAMPRGMRNGRAEFVRVMCRGNFKPGRSVVPAGPSAGVHNVKTHAAQVPRHNEAAWKVTDGRKVSMKWNAMKRPFVPIRLRISSRHLKPFDCD